MVRRIITVAVVLTCLILAVVWGIWHLVGKRESQTTGLPSIDELAALPYVTWVPVDETEFSKSGVTLYHPDFCYGGINFYFTENKPGGHFFDMSGNVLHRFSDNRPNPGNWQLVEPYQAGHFLVIIQSEAIFMIDWNSNIQWELKGGFHHDVAIDESGDIYTLMHGKIDAPDFTSTEPVRNDWLVILTKDGEIKKTISFVDLLRKKKKLYEAAINREEKRYEFGKDAWDLFHSNSVQIIDRDVYSGDRRLFKKGDVLFCTRHQNLIGAIDVEAEEIVWYWGPDDLDFPHHASLLENDRILIFDNVFHDDYSRVIELDPATGEVAWEYKADPPQSFRSPTRGCAQRFPNGNTLIAESDSGRIFEITRGGEIVWEFHNPERGVYINPDTNQQEYRRATIYRMLRIVDPDRYPQLKKAE